MRVCVLAYAFYESDSRIIRYAEALDRRGAHVDVIALRESGTECYAEINGVHVYKIQERTKNERSRLSYAFRIIRFFLHSAWFITTLNARARYDLVHVHSVPDFEVFAAIYPKLIGAKIILDIHDIVPEFYISKFGKNHKGAMFNILVLAERLSVKFSDHVIISNDIWKKKLESRSVSPGKCTSLINYADSSIFYKRSRTRNDEKLIILYPGTLNWHQGLDVAIKAFDKIKDDAPNAYFNIYGDGPERNRLIEMIDKMNLKERVFIKPIIAWREIAKVVSDADIGVIPKRNDQFGGEAFSTKTLEFMAAGVPIVLSKTKIDQYYFNENIVKFFEPGDADDLAVALLHLIKNRNIRDKLSNNGLEFAQKHSWDEKKEYYLELVDKICGDTRKLII